jgi:hypothetical protein
MQQRRCVRFLDDDGSDRRLEQIGGRLIAAAEEPPAAALDLTRDEGLELGAVELVPAVSALGHRHSTGRMTSNRQTTM